MARTRWGRIVSMSSVAAVLGNRGQANYAAAKAALHGASKSLAREMGSRGITVNVVAPGFITTDLTQDLGQKVRDEAKGAIALGRFGVPDEVAGAAESRVAVGALALVTAVVMFFLSRREGDDARLRNLGAFLVVLGLVLLAVGIRGL